MSTNRLSQTHCKECGGDRDWNRALANGDSKACNCPTEARGEVRTMEIVDAKPTCAKCGADMAQAIQEQLLNDPAFFVPEETPQGVKWADVVRGAVGIAELALALQATCPTCGEYPVLGIRKRGKGAAPPHLWFGCTCGAHTVNGGGFDSDEMLVSIIRSLPALWLKNHRGNG